jgi:hypothetical protein
VSARACGAPTLPPPSHAQAGCACGAPLNIYMGTFCVGRLSDPKSKPVKGASPPSAVVAAALLAPFSVAGGPYISASNSAAALVLAPRLAPLSRRRGGSFGPLLCRRPYIRLQLGCCSRARPTSRRCGGFLCPTLYPVSDTKYMRMWRSYRKSGVVLEAINPGYCLPALMPSRSPPTPRIKLLRPRAHSRHTCNQLLT